VGGRVFLATRRAVTVCPTVVVDPKVCRPPHAQSLRALKQRTVSDQWAAGPVGQVVGGLPWFFRQDSMSPVSYAVANVTPASEDTVRRPLPVQDPEVAGQSPSGRGSPTPNQRRRLRGAVLGIVVRDDRAGWTVYGH
jgi:hypothetical protein